MHVLLMFKWYEVILDHYVCTFLFLSKNAFFVKISCSRNNGKDIYNRVWIYIYFWANLHSLLVYFTVPVVRTKTIQFDVVLQIFFFPYETLGIRFLTFRLSQFVVLINIEVAFEIIVLLRLKIGRETSAAKSKVHCTSIVIFNKNFSKLRYDKIFQIFLLFISLKKTNIKTCKN